MPPHGIMFHHFHDAGAVHSPSQGSIDAAALCELLAYVGVERILPADVWQDRAARQALEADDVCLTFDDTLRCQYDVALPVLRAHGLTAFWFVSTGVFDGTVSRTELYRAVRERHFRSIDDFYSAFFWALQRSAHSAEVERELTEFDPRSFLKAFSFYSDTDRRFRFVRDEILGPQRYDDIMSALMTSVGADPQALARDLWMRADQLRELVELGHVVGLHTHTHPTRVAYLAPAAQEREYRDNYMALMQITGVPPMSMSHPCNSYDATTFAVLRKLGIRVGFRADLSDKKHEGLEHPRQDHAHLIREMRACGSHCSPATSHATSR